jgi:hypothetical protein
VTHFNITHFTCHRDATKVSKRNNVFTCTAHTIQRARRCDGYSRIFSGMSPQANRTRPGRGAAMGEWEGATLRNSHTKCNGLFPIYGPGVRYSAARVM